MTEEAKGKKFSERTTGFLDKVTGSQGAQQPQQTSGQQSTGGVFLPGISNINNSVKTDGFAQGIQEGKIKSNIVLPGITTEPAKTGATLDTTTTKQKRQSYIYASNNNINTKSINEQIEEERTGAGKTLGQYWNVAKTYARAPINNYAKFGFRAIRDSGLAQNFVKKTLNDAGVNVSDESMKSINEIGQKIVLAYNDKINEDFRKLEEKNLDPKIKEKYDNAFITDLLGQGDFVGAGYKMVKGTAENWQMIPEMGLMFLSGPGGLAVMGADVYIQENQGTFEEMIQNGATYDEAKNGAIVVGAINAGIELLLERALGGAKRAGATAFRRLFLKNAQKEVVKTATKKGMAEIFSKGILEMGKGALVEGFEEVLQQIVGNAMVQTINPDRDLFEGARESFEGGFFNLFNGIGGGVNIINDINQNNQTQRNADIEALQYVMEGEQRKAQRMQNQRVQEAKQRMKERFLKGELNPTMDNGYTPSPEQAQQRATENEEREKFEQERDEEYKREMQIENDMINEVLNEGDLNEDLGDPRYQKKELSPMNNSEESSSLGDQAPTRGVRISPENSSGIVKSLDEIKKNLNDLKADTFLQQIKKSILGDEKSSNYVVNKIDGKNHVLRISDHHSNAYRFDVEKEYKRNTSIVIKLMSKKKFRKNKNVDLVEFVYDPANMTPEIMQGIIDGVQNWLQTGEYTDTHYADMKRSTRTKGQQQTGEKHQLKYQEEGYIPGVANKNEKNISGKEGINLRNKFTKETVKQLAEKYGIKVEVIEGMIKVLENGAWNGKDYAYGKYLDQLLTLSEQIKESTAPHELLHAIFDMIDPETKTYLISQVMTSEGWSAEKAEEWLADSFSNFFRTGKIESAPKSTRGKIKIFFKRVRSFINGIYRWRNQLEEIFTDIIESNGIEDLQGKIDRNENLKKAKEKMRKRFMEYEKRAEKTRNQKSRDEKLQRVYHGSPSDFDKFDSSHMGEGEGAQAHGWGHYVTLDENTGRSYASKLAGPKWKGKETFELAMNLNGNERNVIREVTDKMTNEGASVKEGIESSKRWHKLLLDEAENGLKRAKRADDIKFYERKIRDQKAMIEFANGLVESDFESSEGRRNLYEVEIPDTVSKNTPTGSNYIEEEEILSDEVVGEIISELEKQKPTGWESVRTGLEFNMSEGGNVDGRNLVYNLGAGLGMKEASKFLESLGYDGIFYNGGQDGKCYVIFDDNKLEIKNHEKYQKIEENQKYVDELRNVQTKEDGVKYIMRNGKEIKNQKPEDLRERSWRRQQFTNSYIFGIKRGDNTFVQNLIKLIKGKSQFAQLSDSILMNEEKFIHTYESHGAFAPENLIATVNHPDDIVESPFGQENIKYYLKKIPGISSFFKAVIEKNSGLRTTTFFEKITGDKDSYSRELEKTNQKRSGGKSSTLLLSEDSIIKNGENANENVGKYQKTEEKRYRGQEEMGNEGRGIKHNKTAVTENTEGGVFVTPYRDDAVKYGDYILEFKKLKENTVTAKEADKLQERATKQVESDLKNQIDTDYLIEQMALGRLRGFAEYMKKPFVETGSPIGEKGEAVFFEDIAKKYNVKYQKVEYEYDENGKPKRIKFGEDNNEFDPSIFGEPTREEQMQEDKENEKSNPFYNAWVKYNNQNYKDDQLTFEEFIQGISERGEREQSEYDKKLNDISEAQNDPQMLELQLKAVKLMEEEGKVGKKFGKNVSKEVRDRQQKEVETKREQLVKDIFEWMYPGLRFEDATYEHLKEADQKEADWEMLGRERLEEKLKYFKKDKNGNRETKDIKVENPQIKLDKLLSSGKFDEIFTPLDRVIEWKTPQGEHGVIDNQKNPKLYKSVMEKINSGKTKTKVELKDVTKDYRALEKHRADQEAEKERKKKERNEAYAKKKQEEYRKIVMMKAFQRLIDMQWLEKYPFLSEDEIKNRYEFSDEEWKKITEQEEIKLPKKRGEKAIKDLNKAVDSKVRSLIEGLSWQNNMKQRDAEKNLGEIGDIDIDVLLGRDEEKGQKEVEEFEKLAKEKGEDNTKKRLEEARENVMNVEIDTERENDKSEKKKIDKLIKSTKTDKTVRGSVKQFSSDILTPVSTQIKGISKKVHQEVMRYFQDKDIKTNKRLKEIDPFLKALGKIRKENPVRFMDVRVALANRNLGYANGLLKEYNVTVPVKLLDEIYLEADDVGLNINYLGNYYPLSVKAPKSFLEELMKIDKGDIASEIEKRITEESAKKGGQLEESEITAIINDIISGGEQGPDVNTGNKHLKKRNTEIKRTPQMLEYCDDPISTLITYLEGMTQSIEKAKFLGKSRSGNVHTLADYVYNAKNGLDPEQQDKLMDLLKAVFNDESPNKFVQARRDLGTLTTLGSPSSTLTQLSDLSFSVYENGWKTTLSAVRDIFTKNKAFNLEDIGVLNRGEEYTNINSQKNLLQKAIHNTFKLTFFSTFDTFGKSAYIQSSWRKRQKRAKQGEKGDKQFRKDINKRTDDEYMTDKIINDLKNGKFSEEVALVMYMKLSNIQPLTKAQMPKVYLNNPNGRLFYQFKTFGIKQLDYVLQETKEQTKDFKNLSATEKMGRIAQIANMVFIMTLLGAGADELKDLTMRRRSNSLILRWLFGEKVETEQIWEKMEDNVLKLFGLSRYTLMQMKSDPVDAITNLFTTLPATNLVIYPFKDINKAIKNDGSIDWRNPASYQLIPIIGKYRYWIYGGGHDKQMESLEKGKKKSKSKSGGGLKSKV